MPTTETKFRLLLLLLLLLLLRLRDLYGNRYQQWLWLLLRWYQERQQCHVMVNQLKMQRHSHVRQRLRHPLLPLQQLQRVLSSWATPRADLQAQRASESRGRYREPLMQARHPKIPPQCLTSTHRHEALPLVLMLLPLLLLLLKHHLLSQ